MEFKSDKNLIRDIIETVNPRTLIFVGAGASVDFGMPLMVNFFNRYYGEFNWHNLSERVKKNELTGDDLIALCILNYIEEAQLSKGGDLEVDLEKLLNYMLEIKGELEGAYNKSKSLSVAQSLAVTAKYGLEEPRSAVNIWESFITDLTEAVDSLVLRLYEIYGGRIDENGFIASIITTYRCLFDSLIRKGNIEGSIAIFTTNYDPCLDIFFDNNPGSYYRYYMDGVDRVIRSNEWSLANYIRPTGGDVIALFNLHGSVLWKRQGEVIFKTDPNSMTPINNVSEVTLIPPVLFKRREGIFEDMYDLYGEMCRSPELKHYLSIGYSYRDPEIKELTVNGLRENEAKMIFISPNADNEVLGKGFVGRSYPIKTRFSEPTAGTEITRVLKTTLRK